MKVLIAAVAFSSEMSGVQRHAFNAVQSLLLRKEIEAVHLVIAPWQRKIAQDTLWSADSRLILHAVAIEDSAISRNAWYYRHLPELACELSADIVHLAYPVPVNASGFNCPVAVTLHDMYPYEIPRNFGFPKVLVNRMILRQCLSAVDAIACVSKTTQQRMCEYLPAKLNEKAMYIPNCVMPMPEAEQPAALNWHGEPFLICIAQHRCNKNIPLLLGSFAYLLRAGKIDTRTQLFVIGINGPETKRIHEKVTQYGLSARVQLLSGVSEGELHWCYANCDALVAPSITEGFGLPVAEGLLAGCRVVCSEIGAHREFSPKHCYFVDLGDNAEQSLADTLTTALDEPRPQPLALPQFSADKIGAQYIQLYHNLLESWAVENRRKFGIAVREV